MNATTAEIAADKINLMQDHLRTVGGKYLVLFDNSVVRCNELCELFNDASERTTVSDDDIGFFDQLKKLREVSIAARMKLETDIEIVARSEYDNATNENRHTVVARAIELIETFASNTLVPFNTQIEKGIARIQAIAMARLC